MILSRLNKPQLTALDFAIAGAATLVAAAIRLPALQTIPVFTDEIHDMEFAQRIAQGGYWPIVSYDMYNGPGLYYLLALGMRLGGGALWPRFLVLIIGSLTVGSSTVGVTYTGPYQFAQTSGGTNYWVPDAYTSAAVDNGPPDSDIIALNAGGPKTTN